MSVEKDNNMIVTIRIKSKVAELYKIIMIAKKFTVTDDLTRHIYKQVNKYEYIDNQMEIEDTEYTKINIRIDRDLYARYKIQMILNHTTPTADIIRYVLKTIENNQSVLKDV